MGFKKTGDATPTGKPFTPKVPKDDKKGSAPQPPKK